MLLMKPVPFICTATWFTPINKSSAQRREKEHNTTQIRKRTTVSEVCETINMYMLATCEPVQQGKPYIQAPVSYNVANIKDF